MAKRRRRVVDEMFIEIRESVMRIVAASKDNGVAQESLSLLEKLNSYELLLHMSPKDESIDKLLLAYKDGNNIENMEYKS